MAVKRLPHGRQSRPLSRASTVAALMGCAIIASAPARANIVAPAGLLPGDTFRLVFVESPATVATSSSIAFYDNLITSDACPTLCTYNGSAVTWHVLGSTASVSAVSRDPATTTSSPIYRLDGALVASNGADLWSGNISAPINDVVAAGVYYPGGYNGVEWTGTNANGTSATGHELGSSTPVIGYNIYTDYNWVDTGGAAATASQALYAISSTMTVPTPVPEPLGLSVFGLGLIGLGTIRHRGGMRLTRKTQVIPPAMA